MNSGGSNSVLSFCEVDIRLKSKTLHDHHRPNDRRNDIADHQSRFVGQTVDAEHTAKVSHSLPRKRQISSEFILYNVVIDVSITNPVLCPISARTRLLTCRAHNSSCCVRAFDNITWRMRPFLRSAKNRNQTVLHDTSPQNLAEVYYFATQHGDLCHIYSVFALRVVYVHQNTRSLRKKN